MVKVHITMLWQLYMWQSAFFLLVSAHSYNPLELLHSKSTRKKTTFTGPRQRRAPRFCPFVFETFCTPLFALRLSLNTQLFLWHLNLPNWLGEETVRFLWSLYRYANSLNSLWILPPGHLKTFGKSSNDLLSNEEHISIFHFLLDHSNLLRRP